MASDADHVAAGRPQAPASEEGGHTNPPAPNILVDEARSCILSDPNHAFELFLRAADRWAELRETHEEAASILEAIDVGLAHCQPPDETLLALNERALQRLGPERPALLGRAHLQRAELEDRRDDQLAAEGHLTEALPLLRAHGTPDNLASAETFMADIARANGRSADAETWYAEALHAWDRAGRWGAAAAVLMKRARLAGDRGQPMDGVVLGTHALERLAQAPWFSSGARLQRARCHALIGDLLIDANEREEAVTSYKEAEALYRALGHADAEPVAGKLKALGAA